MGVLLSFGGNIFFLYLRYVGWGYFPSSRPLMWSFSHGYPVMGNLTQGDPLMCSFYRGLSVRVLGMGVERRGMDFQCITSSWPFRYDQQHVIVLSVPTWVNSTISNLLAPCLQCVWVWGMGATPHLLTPGRSSFGPATVAAFSSLSVELNLFHLEKENHPNRDTINWNYNYIKFWPGPNLAGNL